MINTDWWEPITELSGKEIIGQVEVLQALGSQEQIENLEKERGFKKELVTANTSRIKLPSFKQIGCKDRVKNGVTKKSILTREQNLLKNLTPKIPSVTADIGVQSDLEMEPSKMKETSSDKMEVFLTQLLAQQQKKASVESSTNTDNVPQSSRTEETVEELKKKSVEATNSELKKTSELLDSLEEAFALNDGPKQQAAIRENADSFKAHIVIENALHLPSRRKCRLRKSKMKNSKRNEDVLPSTYVTFETLSESEVQITPVIQRSTNPVWDFRCDAILPIELLTNVSSVNNLFKICFVVWFWNKI